MHFTKVGEHMVMYGSYFNKKRDRPFLADIIKKKGGLDLSTRQHSLPATDRHKTRVSDIIAEGQRLAVLIAGEEEGVVFYSSTGYLPSGINLRARELIQTNILGLLVATSVFLLQFRFLNRPELPDKLDFPEYIEKKM